MALESVSAQRWNGTPVKVAFEAPHPTRAARYGEFATVVPRLIDAPAYGPVRATASLESSNEAERGSANP